MAEIKFLFFCILVLLNVRSFAQETTQAPGDSDNTDLIEVFTKIFHFTPKQKPAISKRVAFSIIPTATTSGGKNLFVSSVNAAFIIGNDSKTNVPTVFFLPYTDFSENLGFGLKYNLFTHKLEPSARSGCSYARARFMG